MKYLIAATLSLSVSFSTPVAANPHMSLSAKPDEISRFSLGEIRVNITESKVLRLLGKPIRQKNSTSGCVGNTKELTYLAGTVILVEDGTKDFIVHRISTKSHNWKTEKGVKVGDSASQIRKHYKSNSGDQIFDGSNYFSFLTNSSKKIVEIDLTSTGFSC